MFKSAPNPQDPASSSKTGDAELDAAEGGDKFKPATSMPAVAARKSQSQGPGMPCCHSRSEKKADEHHKGFMICKHLPGDPNQVYDIGHQVGEGTFGSVRKARHRQTGQIHA